ncbi:hypothetical protein O6P43_008006 [Quillaja saponaria]|uniref:Uncharacterized protein n=1 Tax=Quillaja saponaria TaxID=32244 RepID=A0AAD7PW83_QUISA|nr:hypothetical protein O6P43_008006 [Quillaja saponaria]
MNKYEEYEYWSWFCFRDILYILEDNKDNFLKIMNNLPFKPEVFPVQVMLAIVSFGTGSPNIFNAVLNGETGLKVDVTAVCTRTGRFLLHAAAGALNFDMVDKLMSRRETYYDLRCNQGMLPFTYALLAFRFVCHSFSFTLLLLNI